MLAACGVLADGNRVLVLHLAPRTKEDSARLPEVLRRASAACLIGLLRLGQKVPSKAVWGYFTPMPAPLHPVGDTAGGTRNASSVSSRCTN